jgi:hypothetical protein
MAAGAGFTPGRLTSDTTGRSPYVELIDVAPTILAAMGVAVPSTMAGQRWRMSTRGTTLARDRHDFVDMSRHAQVRSRWGGWFAAVLIGFGVAACVLGSLFLLCGVRRRAAVEALCYFTSALPVSTYMLQVLPWWRWNFVVSSTCVGLLAVVLAVAALVAARRWPPWGGLAFVVTSTALVLGVDLLTGSHLQLDGLLGDSTTVAGRFRGAGNTAFAVFAAAALLTAGVVASALRKHGRRVAVAGAVVVGLFALVLDGAPSLGDDLGGVLAIAPALAVLTLLLLGVRLGVRVWLVAGALAVLAGGALIAYDAIAGGGHIGRFAGQAGSNGARVTIDRKLAANLGSWHRSDYLAVVGFGVAAVIVTWRRTYRALAASSGVRAAFVAVAVCGVVGGALNDSGVVVPGAVALVAVPLLLAGSLRAQQ